MNDIKLNCKNNYDKAINKTKEITKTESNLLFEILKNIDDSQLLNVYKNFLSVHSDDYLIDNKLIYDIEMFLKAKKKIVRNLNEAYWEKLIETCNKSIDPTIKLKSYYIDTEKVFEVHLDFPPAMTQLCLIKHITFDVDKTYAPDEKIYMYLQDETACRLCFILQDQLSDLEIALDMADTEDEKILYKKSAERLTQVIELVHNDYCDYGDFEEYDVLSINTILLYGLLAEDGRYDDIERAKKDISFAKTLAEEYEILNNVLK